MATGVKHDHRYRIVHVGGLFHVTVVPTSVGFPLAIPFRVRPPHDLPPAKRVAHYRESANYRFAAVASLSVRIVTPIRCAEGAPGVHGKFAEHGALYAAHANYTNSRGSRPVVGARHFPMPAGPPPGRCRDWEWATALSPQPQLPSRHDESVSAIPVAGPVWRSGGCGGLNAAEEALGFSVNADYACHHLCAKWVIHAPGNA